MINCEYNIIMHRHLLLIIIYNYNCYKISDGSYKLYQAVSDEANILKITKRQIVIYTRKVQYIQPGIKYMAL